ncbi:MAG TPA: DUF2905 domain-containing protein [Terriglobales bacterium]|jgi:hypothetical protein
MAGAARLLITAGVVLVALGVLVIVAQRMRLPLGHLPGDVVWRGRHTTAYFPWVTMLVLSAILTLILNLFRR